MIFRRLAILALGGLLALPALAADDPSALAAEYHAVASRLTAHVVDSAWLDAAPEAPGLLDRHWALAGQWMAAWLDTHPQADAGALIAAFGEMQGTRDAVAAQARVLGQGSWLVALPGPFGNVFILARRDGHYRVAWSIARQRVPASAREAVVAAWQARNARQDTGVAAGPMDPETGLLPADGSGRARFWIDAARAQAAGGTLGAQVSLWQWDGQSARLRVVHPYAQSIDRSRGARIEDGLLKVREKGEYRSFMSCGACAGRELDWVVRADPRGLQVLGEQSVVRGLDEVDALFARRLGGRPADDLATPVAIAAVDAIIAQVRGDGGGEAGLGMLGDHRISEHPEGIDVCLATDEIGGHRFTLRKGNGGVRVVAVAAAPSGCGAEASP